MKVVADGTGPVEFEPVQTVLAGPAVEYAIPLSEHAGEDAIPPEYRYRRRATSVLDRGGYVIVIAAPDNGTNYHLSLNQRYFYGEVP